MEDHHGARAQVGLRLVRQVQARRRLAQVALVAARHQPGAAVAGVEVGQRPDRVHHQRRIVPVAMHRQRHVAVQGLCGLARPHHPGVQRPEDQVRAHHRLDVGEDGGVVDDGQEHGIERHQVGEVPGGAAVAVLDADVERHFDDVVAHRPGDRGVEDVVDHREAPDLELVESARVDPHVGRRARSAAFHRSSSGCCHCEITPASTSADVRSSS